MIKQGIKKALRALGYEIYKLESASPGNRPQVPIPRPPPIAPVWPLPRRAGGPSEEAIREAFAKYDEWPCGYEFEGGLSFPPSRKGLCPSAEAPERIFQRFKHFMPYLVDAANGSLRGKRILDIACNSGFLSIQCALLGAEVVGFDARPGLIEQANLIKSIVQVDHVEFEVRDFWDMSPQSMGGPFDFVLNLGILYHLHSPLEALRLTKAMARKAILLDTALCPSNDAMVQLKWEDPIDLRAANNSGIVAYPSKGGIDLMLRHVGFAEWFEIPIRSADVPRDYLDQRRAAWLIKV